MSVDGTRLSGEELGHSLFLLDVFNKKPPRSKTKGVFLYKNGILKCVIIYLYMKGSY
jgi:hypothetical protein